MLNSFGIGSKPSYKMYLYRGNIVISVQKVNTNIKFISKNYFIYFKSCSPGGEVGCEALAEFPSNFQIVGLGFDSASSNPQAIRLFGFMAGQTAWTHHTLNGNEMTLSTTATKGIRIRNQVCLDKLMILFRESTSSLDIPVDNAGVKGKASLFGEVFMFQNRLNRNSLF